MKNIKTKSINEPKGREDGLRICVMRRIRPEYDFDMWIPTLAPSNKLLHDYVIDKKISWEQFSYTFKKTVLKKKRVTILLRNLVVLSENQKITLLCGEKSIKYCHRKLLIEACKKLK